MKFNVGVLVLELSGLRKMDNLPALCCAATTTNTTTQQNNMSANHRKEKQKKTGSEDEFNQAMQAINKGLESESAPLIPRLKFKCNYSNANAKRSRNTRLAKRASSVRCPGHTTLQLLENGR